MKEVECITVFGVPMLASELVPSLYAFTLHALTEETYSYTTSIMLLY